MVFAVAMHGCGFGQHEGFDHEDGEEMGNRPAFAGQSFRFEDFGLWLQNLQDIYESLGGVATHDL